MTKKETIDCKKEFRARLQKAYGFTPSMGSITLLEADSSTCNSGKTKYWCRIFASVAEKDFYASDNSYVLKVDDRGFQVAGHGMIKI